MESIFTRAAITATMKIPAVTTTRIREVAQMAITAVSVDNTQLLVEVERLTDLTVLAVASKKFVKIGATKTGLPRKSLDYAHYGQGVSEDVA